MLKILICDDEESIRNIMDFSLESEGFLVVAVADGESALHAAMTEQPDAVVLDVMMPGAMDGLQACREIKQNPRTAHIPVVMLSAKATAADREAGREAGAAAYMTKPFSPGKLVGKLNELLGVHG